MATEAQADRLRIGQLLVNLLRLFRAELAARGEAIEGVQGIRPAHLQVFGTIKAHGSRLTELASASSMSLSAMAELIDDLEHLAYVERRPDPSDGRAKLVFLTATGWEAIRQGRRIIEQIEAHWADRFGRRRFEALCGEMQTLLDGLDPGIRARYLAPPARDQAADEQAGSARRRRAR
jgi:DNA-binding MarR family transcriptional regulator